MIVVCAMHGVGLLWAQVTRVTVANDTFKVMDTYDGYKSGNTCQLPSISSKSTKVVTHMYTSKQ